MDGLKVHLGANARRYAFGIAFLAGLAIRLVSLRYRGTGDMHMELGWGAAAAHHGLAHAYTGTYFPVQWWIFEEVWRAAREWDMSAVRLLRIVNLAADAGCFFLIAVILRKWGRSPSWALFYWLHPYFVTLGALGYVDVQGLFFVLLGVVLIPSSADSRGWLVAGVPLGLVLLMKPEGAELVLFVGLLVTMDLMRDRALSTRVREGLSFLIAPAIFFAGGSAYLALAGGHSITFLAQTFLHTSTIMKSLSAQMPNIWLPVAEALRKTNEPEYAVVHPTIAHVVATIVTSFLLVATAALCSRSPRRTGPPRILPLWALCAGIVPMTLTEAHENHFFLAGVLLMLLGALTRDRPQILLLGALLLVQAANLFVLYAFGHSHIVPGWATTLLPHYTRGWATAGAVVSVGLFAAIVVRVVPAVRVTGRRALAGRARASASVG